MGSQLKVVFTGPGFDAKGNSVVRADLIAKATGLGLIIQTGVRADTDVLVASRTDTVKAKKAGDHGLVVLSYPVFIENFLGGEVPRTKAEASVFVDKDFSIPDDNWGIPDEDIL